MADLTQLNKELDDLFDRAGKELDADDLREFYQQTANKAESAEEALDEDENEEDDQDDAMDEAEDDEDEDGGQEN